MSWIFKSSYKKVNSVKSAFSRQALSFEALEPRLLLSADAFGGVIDASDMDIDTQIFSNYDKIRDDLNAKLMLSNSLNSDLITTVQSPVDDATDTDAYQNKFDLTLLNNLFTEQNNPDILQIKQLIFVDEATEEVELLLGDSFNDPSSQVVYIHQDDKALEVMTAEIQKYNNLDSIHIISHGSAGSLAVGSDTFDINFLNDDTNKELFLSWRSSMAQDADLLLYGCNFSEGDIGQEALSRMAEVTGLNTAASDDITGSTVNGGDWQLEQTVGEVDTQLVVSLDVQDIWQHSLATIVVNTTDDTALSGYKNVNTLLTSESEISLREAIQAIAYEPTWSTTVHTIEFDLDGDHTINLSSQLPSLQRAMIIDGTTEADYAGEPVVKIKGVGDIFRLTGSDIEIKGLEISGGANGIVISGSNNIVQGNYIFDNNANGINVSGSGNQIGGDLLEHRNIISGNTNSGILVSSNNANGNLIQGNWIGLDSDGETDKGNGGNGITINTSQGTGVVDNVISGNAEHGLQIYRISSFPSNHIILGNIIGLNALGTSAVGNDLNGLELFEVKNIDVGDGTEAGRNIISGNGHHGVNIVGAGTELVTVSGNYIGTDVSGGYAIGNYASGIQVYDGPSGGSAGTLWDPSSNARIYIGGDQVTEGNLISGNGDDGITLNQRATYIGIVNNIIGLDASAENAIGNGLNGIKVISGQEGPNQDVQVFILNNSIAYNQSNGILVDDYDTFGVYMVENLIFSNEGLSIDLGGDGVTENDTADFDAGANRLLNFPEIASVEIVDGQLHIQGSLEYNSGTQGNVTIHFYYAMDEGDDGAAYATSLIGSYEFDSGYTSSIDFDRLFDFEIPSGAFITAATTSPFQVGTSEFASAVQLTQGNIPNQSATGDVSFSGSLIQGALLTASHTLNDGNGVSQAMQHQWRRNGVAIDGANDDTYLLQQADVNQSISLNVSFTDNEGYDESVTSAASVAIENVNDLVTGTVTISGVRTEGETLTVSVSLLDIDGLPDTYNYQWARDGVAIGDATNQSYELVDEDVGSQISVSVSYIDLLGSAEIKASAASVAIANVNDSPDGDVTISGSFVENSVLSAQVNITDADGLPSTYSYQWYRDDVSISGASTVSYTLDDVDVGSVIKVAVSYQDDRGANEIVYSLNSDIVSNVNDAPVGNLYITGSNVEGQTLGAQVSFTDADGLSGAITYQWYRDDVVIVGETSVSYLITNMDVGTRLSVTASYQDDFGFDETVSSTPTNLVNNTNQSPTGDVSITGLAVENNVLGVDINLSDEDGLPPSYTYQWYRDGAPILYTNQMNYQLMDDDVGSIITVEVSYEDNLGSNESVLSAGTAEVANVNDAPTGEVSIVGSNIEGQTISAQINLADEDGISSPISYQWLRDGSSIIGATDSIYSLAEIDVGTNLTLEVSYVDGQNTPETFLSSVFGPIVNLNQNPSGSLDIAGLAREDEILSADLNFTDTDGLPSNFTYQWYRDGVAIDAATNNFYQLSDDDVTKQVSVSVAYVDLHGSEEELHSSSTLAIVNLDDAPTGDIKIVGDAQEGILLSVENTVVDDDGIETDFGYQWFRDNIAIAGANDSAYQLLNDDVGKSITVTWRYTDSHGADETITSQALVGIENVNSDPSGTVSISGLPEEDQLIVASHSITDEDGVGSNYDYQWYRDGVEIIGADSSSMQLGDDDVDSTLHVIVSYTDDLGTRESVASSGFGTITGVNDVPTGMLELSGNFFEDELITVVDAVSDDDGIPDDRSYLWFRDGQVINGVTGTSFILTQEDVGAQISVSLSYTDLQDFDESISSSVTPIIANVNDLPSGAIQIAGSINEGEVLTAQNSVVDEDGISSTQEYRWYRDAVRITGEFGQSYTLTNADVGAQISAEFQYIDDHGSIELVAAAPVGAVVNVNDAPTGSVKIIGIASEGSTLQVQHDINDVDGLPENLNYQWYRDGLAIDGAIAENYQVVANDIEREISVSLSYTDQHGTDESVLSSLVSISALISSPVMTVAEVSLSFDLGLSDTLTGVELIKADVIEESAKEIQAEDSGESDDAQVNDGIEPVSNLALRVPAKSIFSDSDLSSSDLDGQSYTGSVLFNFSGGNSGHRVLAEDSVNGVQVEWSQTAVTSVGGWVSDISIMLNILGSAEYSDRLDQSVKEHEENNVTLSSTIVGGTAAASTGLSVGYLLWTLRSGVLMTSLLSSLPAWRFVDPLPILAGEKDKSDDDQESLESMVESSQKGIDNDPEVNCV